MSTLLLADLDQKMRRELGLEPECSCTGMKTGFVARIPVIETDTPRVLESERNDSPGSAWLRTGLHRLRVPPSVSHSRGVSEGYEFEP